MVAKFKELYKDNKLIGYYRNKNKIMTRITLMKQT